VKATMKALLYSSCGVLVAAACGAPRERDYVVVDSAGTLVVDWTVDGVKDVSQCDQGGAAVIDVTVQTASGEDAGEFQADCGAFSTTIDLPVGSYVATAVLVDGTGNQRTTPIDLNPFRIHGNDVLTTPIDFPADSFL